MKGQGQGVVKIELSRTNSTYPNPKPRGNLAYISTQEWTRSIPPPTPMGTPSLKLDLSSLNRYSISLGNPVATSLAATKGEGKSDSSDPNSSGKRRPLLPFVHMKAEDQGWVKPSYQERSEKLGQILCSLRLGLRLRSPVKLATFQLKASRTRACLTREKNHF